MSNEPTPRTRSNRGQAMIEFIIIFWFAFSLLMLVIQIVLMFNAHSMMKLAAFNAARAAIVARDAQPERGVTLIDMRNQARLAAFLTILPVIPGFHAQTLTIQDLPGLATGLANSVGGGISGIGALAKGHGRGLAAVLVEFFSFDKTTFRQLFSVRFVNPTAPDPGAASAEITNWPATMEFDDTGPNAAPQNRIKVVVEWYYPLVIPLADQIIYALLNPTMYFLAYAQKGNLQGMFDTLTGQYRQRPVWEVGWGLRDPTVFGPWNITGFRIPIRTSYVMRMHWDRRPNP